MLECNVLPGRQINVHLVASEGNELLGLARPGVGLTDVLENVHHVPPSRSHDQQRPRRDPVDEPIGLPLQNLLQHTLTFPKLIPAPRGTGLVASPAVKRLLQLAGVDDIYTSSSGSTKTLENTLKATFVAVGNTYGYLTPNLWKETKLIRSPLEEFGDVLRAGKRY